MKLLFSLAVFILFIPLVAQSAEGKSDRFEHVKPRFMTPYLMSCEGLLDALNDGRPEEFLLSTVQSPEQIRELLVDYQILFSNLLKRSILSVLYDQVAKELSISDLAGLASRLYSKDMYPESPHVRQILMAEVGRWLRLSNDDLDVLLRKILDKLRILSADGGAGKDEVYMRVLHLRTNRMIDAMTSERANPELMRTFEWGVKLVLLEGLNRLVKKTLERAAMGSPSRATVTLGSVIAGGVAVSQGFALAFPEGAIGYPGYDTLLAVSSFCGTVCGAVGGGYLGWKLPYWGRTRGIRKMEKDIEAEVRLAEVDRRFDLISLSLFESSKEVVDSKVPSLDEACAMDPCSLNPAQLLYLGHLELLQARAAATLLTNELTVEKLLQLVDLILDVSRKLIQWPTSPTYRVQFIELTSRLRAMVNEGDTKNSEDGKNKLQLFKEIVARTKEHIKTLNKKPYEFMGSQDTVFNDAKREALAIKMQSDLQELINLESKTKAFFKFVDQIVDVGEDLWDAGLPDSGDTEGWVKFAENSVLTAERIRARLTE